MVIKMTKGIEVDVFYTSHYNYCIGALITLSDGITHYGEYRSKGELMDRLKDEYDIRPLGDSKQGESND